MRFIFWYWTHHSPFKEKTDNPPPFVPKSTVLSEVDFVLAGLAIPAMNSDQKPSITYCSLYSFQYIAPCLMAVSEGLAASFFRVDVTLTVKEDWWLSTQSLITYFYIFWYLGKYSDWLRVVLLGFDCQRRQECFSWLPHPDVHPLSYPIGTAGSFLKGKAGGAWNWPLELYLHPPICLLVMVFN
jgi:hypothetical protein